MNGSRFARRARRARRPISVDAHPARAVRVSILLAVLLSAVPGFWACRAVETGATRLDRDGARYTLRLDGEPVVSFTVPALGPAGAPRVDVADLDGPEKGWRRVRLVWDLEAPAAQDELAVRFDLLFEPELWWAPHLAPEEGTVVAQHVFRSPALIAAAGPRVLTVVPDLDLVGARPENPWFLDLDAPKRAMALGLSKTDVPEHVLFRKVPGQVFRPGRVELGFFISAAVDPEPVKDPWAGAASFLWSRWGRPLYAKGEPIPGPLRSYVRRTYDWAFRGWAPFVWQEFDLSGRRVGAPQFIVNVSQSPNSPEPWFQRESLSIWNQAWFSSLRSASGLFRYARAALDEGLMAKARMTKELALAAPVADGLFPSVIATPNEEVPVDGRKLPRPRPWSEARWTNSDRTPVEHGITADWYHVLDMSVTALAMLRWHDELEKDARLLDYARAYGERLLRLQDEAGYFPGWLHPETHAPGPVMNRTPESSLSATFLLKLADMTGEPRFRAAALRAVDAVVADIVPRGRWLDFETFWSCSAWGKDRYLDRPVERNALYKQNTLSMFWTAEALLAAWRATGRALYLDWGRRTLDELSMAQQVWQPPFIHVPALGGFGVMNADGEWNDSRQSLFAELFLDYADATGETAFRERGLAALEAGFVMMYCPENPKVKAMWERVYPWFGPADYGFTMENYGHGGRTSPEGEGMGVFTIYDWGNGAAAEAVLRVLDHRPELKSELDPQR